MLREGTWWLRSKIDPRWNCQGRSSVGGFEMCEEAKLKFESLKNQFGDPLDDLEHRYMKD